MKRFSLLLSALCMAVCLPSIAQNVGNVYDVATIDRHAHGAYRPGEVIVKFKAASPIKVQAKHGASVATSVNNVDAVLSKLGVTSAEQLMPLSGSGGPSRVKAHNGSYIERSDLSNLYRLQLDSEGITVYDAVKALSSLPEVEYAEPNYIVYSLAVEDSTSTDSDAQVYANEPLYSQQWGLPAINLPYLWAQQKITDKRPVIAILDTGVDIAHPDLAGNIWTNQKEAEGFEDSDDDGNGFADDIHGWDFVNQSPRMRDNNGHGTHAQLEEYYNPHGIGVGFDGLEIFL